MSEKKTITKKTATKKVATKKPDTKPKVMPIAKNKPKEIKQQESKFIFYIKIIRPIELRLNPTFDNSSNNIQGRLLSGTVHGIVDVNKTAPMDMYQLDNGLYAMADYTRIQRI